MITVKQKFIFLFFSIIIFFNIYILKNNNNNNLKNINESVHNKKSNSKKQFKINYYEFNELKLKYQNINKEKLKLDINYISYDNLLNSGIKSKIAFKIINYRKKNGYFYL